MDRKFQEENDIIIKYEYYTFDEDYEEYVCDMDMDEDEYIRLISDSHYECPYYRNGDDYRIVRKQM